MGVLVGKTQNSMYHLSKYNTKQEFE
jgi:hypothetical protein